MGSKIELNDTLKISKERGLPKELTLEDHLRNPEATFEKVKGRLFEFWNDGERLYNRPPTRVFLVEEMAGGKWLYWGHAMVIQQTVEAGETRGKFEIVKIYEPEYQRLHTMNEAPKGKSYFG